VNISGPNDPSGLMKLSYGFSRMLSRYANRDLKHQQLLLIRSGRISDLAPDLFPGDGPWQEPIVANMIDVAARDLAEMIAPLPAFNAGSSAGLSPAQEKAAEKRTKILSAILHGSDMQTQMYTAADNFVTFGWAFSKIEYDYDNMLPIIRMLDPMGCYPVIDRWRRCTALYQRTYCTVEMLAELYPELEGPLQKKYDYGDSPADNQLIEVVFHHDEKADTVFLPAGAISSSQAMLLSRVPNPVGKCLVNVAMRPGPVVRGQFDDVMFVQLARSRMALLGLEAAHKSIQAPIIVPPDVTNVPLGPDAHLRTSEPQNVRRLQLDVPPSMWQEDATLAREQREGSRYPELRGGDPSAAGGHVTGKGVQALMEGFDTQVRTAQAVLAPLLTKTASLALECDEKMWGKKKKRIKGTTNGTPFDLEYTPEKAINGVYDVDVQYGLMAGLDPSRWLVFGLQARAEKLISRDYLRRQMPADLDVEAEERKIDVEDTREALKVAVQQYASSIPEMTAQGGDPNQALQLITDVVNGRTKGIPLEKIVSEALAPPEPEPEPELQQAAPGLPAEPGLGPPGAGLPGNPPPSPGGPPGGPPMQPSGDMQADLNMLAGLGASGDPNLSAGVQRQMPI